MRDRDHTVMRVQQAAEHGRMHRQGAGAPLFGHRDTSSRPARRSTSSYRACRLACRTIRDGLG